MNRWNKPAPLRLSIMKSIDLESEPETPIPAKAGDRRSNSQNRNIENASADRGASALARSASRSSRRKVPVPLKPDGILSLQATAIRDYSESDESDLVSAAQDGDMAAFEQLIIRHHDKIYQRAFNIMKNPDIALDLSQESWVKAWQRLNQFQKDSRFRTWLTRIVINLCLDQLRKQNRERAESIEELNEEMGGVERQMPMVISNPGARLERKELRQSIDEALEELSYEQRTVLMLREFEQMDYKEIAKTMGSSIGTVMSRLHYARRKMANLLAGLKANDHYR